MIKAAYLARGGGYFEGVVGGDLPGTVYVFDGTGPRRELTVSSDGPRHSPGGFSWGYRGSGPAQLAFEMLRIVSGGRKPAPRLYQRFKERHLAVIPMKEGWRLTFDVLLDFISEMEAQNDGGILWEDATEGR